MGVYSLLLCVYISELRLDEHHCDSHSILWYFRVIFLTASLHSPSERVVKVRERATDPRRAV